ncbi:MAG TPA: signal peptidase I [Candidatus Magasanikbacteria bacterium]|nr:signal peptidase I [Candidatus Magasanikbacteria bacterium]
MSDLNKEPHNIDNSNDEVYERGALSKVALFFLEIIKISILAAITIISVRYFLFKPFYVKGQSMEPTFHERDYLIIDEISYRFRTPERGEIVVFKSPINTDFYLKRIIALPGERVKVENNTVIVYNEENPRGWVLPEVYLEEETPGSVSLTLGENEYFVLGDNRDSSFDSRRFGAIKKDVIVGRVWFRGWPFSRLSTFSLPEYTSESTASMQNS